MIEIPEHHEHGPASRLVFAFAPTPDSYSRLSPKRLKCRYHMGQYKHQSDDVSTFRSDICQSSFPLVLRRFIADGRVCQLPLNLKV